MALIDKKVSGSNYRPETLNGARIVHATQFNELIDELDQLDVDNLDTRIDALEALVDDGSETQQTSITTGVTLNKKSGVITTVSSTLAAGASATFTVTNSTVTTNSVVILSLAYGGAGDPIVMLNAAPSAGSFVVRLDNVHSSAALNNVLNIYFVVI